MAEQSGKGIALVILGIVAIIAIVGLVLLFTGARNAAVGEVVIPGVKEYGGAIRGVADPYSRAFSGRANEYQSGNVAEYSGQWVGRAGVVAGGQAYGDITDERAVSTEHTYNRIQGETPSMLDSCSTLTEGVYPIEASTQGVAAYESTGATCVTHIIGVFGTVPPGAYPLTESKYRVRVRDAIGAEGCCSI